MLGCNLLVAISPLLLLEDLSHMNPPLFSKAAQLCKLGL